MISDNNNKLQLGDCELKVIPSEKGYTLILDNGKDPEVPVMDLVASPWTVGRVSGYTISAMIHHDYDEPRYITKHPLLHPADRPSVVKLEDGRLYCRKCGQYVENTANEEMRKEGAFAYSHSCPAED